MKQRKKATTFAEVIRRSVEREAPAASRLPKSRARRLALAFLEVVAAEAWKGNRVVLPRFGVFEVRSISARVLKNVENGEPVKLPARLVLRFRSSREQVKVTR